MLFVPVLGEGFFYFGDSNDDTKNGMDLAQRSVRKMGRCERPHHRACLALRIERVRRDTVLRLQGWPGDPGACSPHPETVRLVPHPSHGPTLHAGTDLSRHH